MNLKKEMWNTQTPSPSYIPNGCPPEDSILQQQQQQQQQQKLWQQKIENPNHQPPAAAEAVLDQHHPPAVAVICTATDGRSPRNTGHRESNNAKLQPPNLIKTGDSDKFWATRKLKRLNETHRRNLKSSTLERILVKGSPHYLMLPNKRISSEENLLFSHTDGKSRLKKLRWWSVGCVMEGKAVTDKQLEVAQSLSTSLGALASFVQSQDQVLGSDPLIPRLGHVLRPPNPTKSAAASFKAPPPAPPNSYASSPPPPPLPPPPPTSTVFTGSPDEDRASSSSQSSSSMHSPSNNHIWLPQYHQSFSSNQAAVEEISNHNHQSCRLSATNKAAASPSAVFGSTVQAAASNHLLSAAESPFDRMNELIDSDSDDSASFHSSATKRHRHQFEVIYEDNNPASHPANFASASEATTGKEGWGHLENGSSSCPISPLFGSELTGTHQMAATSGQGWVPPVNAGGPAAPGILYGGGVPLLNNDELPPDLQELSLECYERSVVGCGESRDKESREVVPDTTAAAAAAAAWIRPTEMDGAKEDIGSHNNSSTSTSPDSTSADGFTTVNPLLSGGDSGGNDGVIASSSNNGPHAAGALPLNRIDSIDGWLCYLRE